MSCHVMSCHVMSCHVMSCHVMSCHVMSCHVMSCHVMSCRRLTAAMAVHQNPADSREVFAGTGGVVYGGHNSVTPRQWWKLLLPNPRESSSVRSLNNTWEYVWMRAELRFNKPRKYLTSPYRSPPNIFQEMQGWQKKAPDGRFMHVREHRKGFSRSYLLLQYSTSVEWLVTW